MGRRRTASIRGRGAPEEQAWEIFHNIVNAPPGQSSPSGQAPAPHSQQTRPTQGGRGRVGAGTRAAAEEGKVGGGAWGNKSVGPPPPEEGRFAKRQCSTDKRQDRRQRRKRWKDENRIGDLRGGGLSPPEENADLPALPWNVRTCSCRKSTETSLTTMIGCTCMGESRATLYGSVIGAG